MSDGILRKKLAAADRTIARMADEIAALRDALAKTEAALAREQAKTKPPPADAALIDAGRCD